MESDNMNQSELILWLKTLMDLIKSRAESVDDAVKIIQEQINELKK